MKLLMLSDFWPTAKNPISGVFVQYQVAEYVRQGHEVYVISPVPCFRPSRQRDLVINYAGAEIFSPRALMVPGLLRLPRRLRERAFMATIRAVAGVIDEAIKQIPWMNGPDALHINGFTFAGLALPLLKNRPKIPVIVTLHGVDPLLVCLLDAALIRHVISASWYCVDRLVLCGLTLRSHAANLEAPEQLITVIPNGNDFLMPADTEKTKNPIVVITVANLTPKKGVEVLIRAVHNLFKEGLATPIRCLVIGDGPERNRLEKLVKDLGLAGCFMFLGRLTHDETLHRMAEASVFCLPSEIEAYPIVFLEAMGAGIPAIGCIGTGAEEIIVGGDTGILVPSRDLVALSRALRNLIEDPDMRRRMGLSARSRAKYFTWRINVERYISTFHECGIS
jgi:glycosyltransferase involved in cell wall biosynthesis